MKKIFLCGALVWLALGCSKDKLDFDMLDDLQFGPDMKIPLVNAHLDLNDLEKEDSLLTVDPDNGLRIIYREDSLFEFGALEFVDLPEQDPTPIRLQTGQPPFEVGIGLGTLGGVELADAVFDKGMLRYTASTDMPVSSDVEFTIEITNASLNGSSFIHTYILPQGSTFMEDSIDVSSLSIDLSNGGADINYLGLKAEITDPGNSTAGQNFDLSIQLANLEIGEANGYFGQRQINIPTGQFDFDVSGLSEFTEGLYLENPSIRLITAGNLGFGVQLSPDFFGVNEEGSLASLDPSAFTIPGAEDVNQIDTNVIIIDRNNSQIVDFLASIPNKITYSGKGKLNPDGKTYDNHISRNSKMNMGMEINIPLSIRAENMKITETINDVDIGGEDNPDLIENLTLYFQCDNGFPFDVDLTVNFINAAGEVSEDIDIPLLSPATVDNTGRVIQKNQSTYEVEFTGEDIDALLDAGKIRITGVLNTANNGQQMVKLYTDYELDVNISTRTKVNVKL